MLTFKELWDKYPINKESSPCKTNGKKNFDDQCAIRLGACRVLNFSGSYAKSREVWFWDVK